MNKCVILMLIVILYFVLGFYIGFKKERNKPVQQEVEIARIIASLEGMVDGSEQQ